MVSISFQLIGQSTEVCTRSLLDFRQSPKKQVAYEVPDSMVEIRNDSASGVRRIILME
jgi:hypothetical protein